MRIARKVISNTAAACLIAASVACNDATGPRALTVTVQTQTVGAPTTSVDSLGRQILTCDVTFIAQLSDKGSVSWADGTYRYYMGSNRKAPVDSVPMSQSDIASAWGGDTLTWGDARSADWSFYGTLPFTGEMEFRYRTGGVTKTTTSKFTCGPVIDSTAAVPTITSLGVSPLGATLEAGTPLTVSFAANAPAGLWQTRVDVTGPCSVTQKLSENFQTTATHDVSVALPKDCRLGVPLSVQVVATDAGGRSATRAEATQMPLVDDQRPTLRTSFYPPQGGPLLSTIAGDFFGGDSIMVTTFASDNTWIPSTLWRVAPFSTIDSATTTNILAAPGAVVRLGSAWDGSAQLKFWVHDMAGNTSDTVMTAPDSVRVHPTVTRTTRSTAVAADVRQAVIDTPRGLLYLCDGNGMRVDVISMSTLQVTARIPIGAVPTDFDLTPSGDSLLVVVYGRGSLGVIDLRAATPALTWMPITAADSASGQLPRHVRVASNGKAYVTASGMTLSPGVLVEVDLASGAERIRSEAGGQVGDVVLARSVDGRVIALSGGSPTCLQRFDVGADTFSACVTPPNGSWPVSVDSTGDRLATSLDVYDASMQLQPKLYPPLARGLYGSISPNGQVVYVGWYAGVVRVNAADGRIIDRTLVGFFPGWLRPSADGRELVVIDSGNSGTARIAVIDMY